MKEDLRLAIDIADEFEDILQVRGLAEAVRNYDNKNDLKRDFAAGDVASLVGVFIGLVSLFLQIKQGNTFKGKSKDEIVGSLIEKLASQTELSKQSRERLVTKLIDKIGVD